MTPRQFCRTQNHWNSWNQKRHGVVRQADIAPSDGYGRLPYPHIFGGRCPCHPCIDYDCNGVRVVIHDHPMTEAQ